MRNRKFLMLCAILSLSFGTSISAYADDTTNAGVNILFEIIYFDENDQPILSPSVGCSRIKIWGIASSRFTYADPQNQLNADQSQVFIATLTPGKYKLNSLILEDERTASPYGEMWGVLTNEQRLFTVEQADNGAMIATVIVRLKKSKPIAFSITWLNPSGTP